MEFAAYRKLVEALSFGKKLPDAVYIHKSYIDSTPPELISFVGTATSKYGPTFDWNVIKLSRRDFKISLLAYPTFDEVSYPNLEASLTIDILRDKCRKTSYQDSENPPILHRKETLVPTHYPKYEHFTELTREGEDAGLYENSRRIGFRKNWERLIAQNGYALVDGRIVAREEQATRNQLDDDVDIDIHRHLTAMDRDKLSTPMQSLARHGYLDGEHSILDYGCGKGHDLIELEAHGLDVVGWDPAYRPDGEKRESDIVNLGFVINVIEDRDERVEALNKAFSLANQILIVSVMLGGDATMQKFTPYKDGVVTSRGTFQKYFSQSELRGFIEATLKTKPVAVGAGLFYIFKDELDEQEFLVTRQRVKREWKQLVQRDRLAPSVDYQAIIEKHIDLFKDFWATCLDFGRPPANDEFERSEEIRQAIGSHRKALDASKAYFDDEDYEFAKIGRKKDLTVFLALSFFDRHRAYARMPISLQRDIRAFFEKPSAAYDFAKEALFAIADTEMISIACENAFRKLGCGKMTVGHSYTFAASLLERLPPILRIYVGCAAQLYGDINAVHLIKIHITSGKVSLMIYNDYDKPLPILNERIKIRMRDQQVDFFPYNVKPDAQLLYSKSRYLPKNHHDFRRQVAFDTNLTDLLDRTDDEYGPSLLELLQHLRKRNLSPVEISAVTSGTLWAEDRE